LLEPRSGLMRLRGDLHKVDMVIAQMSLDHMQNPDLLVWSGARPQIPHCAEARYCNPSQLQDGRHLSNMSKLRKQIGDALLHLAMSICIEACTPIVLICPICLQTICFWVGMPHHHTSQCLTILHQSFESETCLKLYDCPVRILKKLQPTSAERVAQTAR
jgi:hypothetical protein